MRENDEKTYYRMSIPILLSNHDFTMTGTDSVKRRQVRIKLTGKLEDLSKRNNPLFMKNINGGFNKENISDDFKKDFWEYVTHVKLLDLKRPKQSQEDLAAMNSTETLLKEFFDSYSLNDINDMKLKKELLSSLKEETGLRYMTVHKMNKFIKVNYNYEQKRTTINGKTQIIYIDTKGEDNEK